MAVRLIRSSISRYMRFAIGSEEDQCHQTGITVLNKERWMELCEQAAIEKDPKKLLALVREINDLLDEKRDRLNQKILSITENDSNDEAGHP